MKLVIVVVLALICVQQYCAKTCRMCPLVNCLRITHSDCKDNEIFVPRDGYCNCCDSCLGKTGRLLNILTPRYFILYENVSLIAVVNCNLNL